ncbi:MAG TPA: hypothetical protein PK765_03785 [bacterium]|nr:hypothetical protein [bacterium]
MDSKSRYKPGKVSVVPGGVVALGKDTTNRAHAFLETFHRVAGGLKNPKDLEELLQETCKAYDTDSASDWVAKEEHVRKFIAEKGQHVSADTYTKLAVLRYEKPTVLPGQTVDPDSPAFQEDLDYAINASDPEESISTFVQKYFNAGPYVISYEEEGDVGTVMIRFLEGNKDPIRFPPKDLWKALLASGVPQKKKFVLFAPSVQTTLNEETGEVIIDLGKESRTYNLSPRSGSEMDREASVSLYTQSDGSIGINIPDSLDANPVVMDGVVYLPSARLFSDPARPSTPELDVFGSKNFSDIDQVLAADPLTAEFLQELLLRSRDTGDYKQLSDIVTRLADQAVQQIKTWSPSQKDQFVANIGKFASGAIGRLSEFQDAEILTGPQMRLAKKLADAIIKLRAERDSLVAQILERQ